MDGRAIRTNAMFESYITEFDGLEEFGAGDRGGGGHATRLLAADV